MNQSRLESGCNIIGRYVICFPLSRAPRGLFARVPFSQDDFKQGRVIDLDRMQDAFAMTRDARKYFYVFVFHQLTSHRCEYIFV